MLRRVTFSQKWLLANVGESDESVQHGLANVGKCWWVWRVCATGLGKCWRVWRVHAARLGKCWQVWRVLAKHLDECWLKQDRLFYAQITYFICIKWSSLHSLNLPNSPNLLNWRKTCQTCLSQVWRVLAKWFGKCRRVRQFAEKGNFWQIGVLAKMANFWQVLEFAKFAREWPVFSRKSKYFEARGPTILLRVLSHFWSFVWKNISPGTFGDRWQPMTIRLDLKVGIV